MPNNQATHEVAVDYREESAVTHATRGQMSGIGIERTPHANYGLSVAVKRTKP